MPVHRYTCVSRYAKAQATAKTKPPACVPPTAYANGSALFFYNSTSYRDDLVWGAAWLYKATGERVRAWTWTGSVMSIRDPCEVLGWFPADGAM